MQQSSDRCLISAVIPVYNDRTSLKQTIPIALNYLEKITPLFELLITEDASTDGSYELANEWTNKDKRIRVLHRDKRLGRGSALNEAVQQFSGEIFCYFDVEID
jgi:glycosyltransferase AglD